MGAMELGRIYTLNLVSQDEMLGYVDTVSMKDQEHVLLLSRLPQRRLLEHVDLDKVEAYWVTTQDVTGSIQPSLEQIHDLVVSRVENHTGIAIIEGIEWLISIHGFSEVLRMVMKMKDSLHRKPWSILLVVAEDIFDEVQITKWQREAPSWNIPKKVEFVEFDEVAVDTEELELELNEKPLNDDGSTPLSFLVRIPREGYSKDIARRRILQWRRMGLDVSSAEPALFQDSDDKGFEIYKSVERKVRRAIELDNRLDILLERGHRSEVTKMRFRVRQLTGFDDVESRIDELI
ncbi:MAG: DUF835 domain-containing protein [Candidatus Poseidoniaceae archaeon]|nr:DUF835 domain-containing protein [Candidatus Poseidoniaceae archaeon]